MAAAVILNLSAPDAPAAIQALVGALAGNASLRDSAQLLSDVLDRESTLTTYVGEGVALPHARSDAVSTRVVAVARSGEGVPFGEKGEKAHLIVLIGCPRADVSGYLAFSRQLLRRLREPGVRAGLLIAQDSASFLGLLELGGESPTPGGAAS